MTDPHSDYMLGNDMRVAILQDAKRYGVQWAAKMHRVSENSIYKWRKVPALAAQVTGDVMTDSDLISGLREWKPWRHEDFYMVKAADRIEALTEQLAAARQDAKEAEAYAEELEKDRDALDAKLAKAVEAVDKAAALIEERHVVHMTAKGRNPKDYISEWSLIAKEVRATLAELKGETHDPL